MSETDAGVDTIDLFPEAGLMLCDKKPARGGAKAWEMRELRKQLKRGVVEDRRERSGKPTHSRKLGMEPDSGWQWATDGKWQGLGKCLTPEKRAEYARRKERRECVF